MGDFGAKGRGLGVALLAMGAACAPNGFSAAGVEGANAASVASKVGIVPVGDYHVHLLGPTAVQPALPQLPAIELPAELGRLLRDRAALYGRTATAEELARVFTGDAQALSWQRPSRWVRGGEALGEVLKGLIPQPYRFQANAFHAGDSTGYVAGLVGAGPSERPALDFLFGIRRGADGAWRIAAENVTVKSAPPYGTTATADKLIADLDDAGIRYGVVLSTGFWLGTRFPDPADEMTREYDAVRAENDWTARQVAGYPGRLVMACSANVLREYAVREMERCKQIPQVRAFKLHFGDADVDLDKPDHLAKVRRFFKAANDRRVPIIVHFSPRRDYDSAYVELFLREVMSQAPDLFVQIAHLGGDGPGLTSPRGTAAFAAVMQAGDPRMKNVYFDFAGLVAARMTPEEGAVMAATMRRIGLRRVLYASDEAPGIGMNRPTLEHWVHTRRKLPLTAAELRIIARNVPPYIR